MTWSFSALFLFCGLIYIWKQNYEAHRRALKQTNQDYFEFPQDKEPKNDEYQKQPEEAKASNSEHTFSDLEDRTQINSCAPAYQEEEKVSSDHGKPKENKKEIKKTLDKILKKNNAKTTLM